MVELRGRWDVERPFGKKLLVEIEFGMHVLVFRVQGYRCGL